MLRFINTGAKIVNKLSFKTKECSVYFLKKIKNIYPNNDFIYIFTVITIKL